jgi:hypothetical protein
MTGKDCGGVGEAAATGDLTCLVTGNSQPFTISGQGNKMHDWRDAAALQHFSRAAQGGCCCLGESGNTAPELVPCSLRMSTNAFLEEYRNRKESVTVAGVKPTSETIRKNNRDKSKPE